VVDDAFKNSIYKNQLESELNKYKTLYDLTQKSYDSLSVRHEELKGRYTALQNQKKAGRKLKNEAWQKQYHKFIEMLEAEKCMEEIMEELEISRATYFRLKKLAKTYCHIKNTWYFIIVKRTTIVLKRNQHK
jgi:predicted ATPase with chaperone activity